MENYSKIKGFLDGYLEKNGIIAEGDDAKLESFMEELGKHVNELSFIPENSGDKLILYSGKHGENMWKYAEAASEMGKGYYYISNTEAGRLITNGDIFDKIGDICNNNSVMIDRIYGNSSAGERRNRYTVGNQLSLNDRISENLVKNAKGNVTVWAPNGETNKVFSDTELRILLTNENVTSINGG